MSGNLHEPLHWRPQIRLQKGDIILAMRGLRCWLYGDKILNDSFTDGIPRIGGGVAPQKLHGKNVPVMLRQARAQKWEEKLIATIKIQLFVKSTPFLENRAITKELCKQPPLVKGFFSLVGVLVPWAKCIYDHFEMEKAFCIISLRIPGPVCYLILSPKEKHFSQVSQLHCL